MADALGKRWVDDEMVPERLETEHRPQQQRRARRPGLRAACGRILHRILRQRPLVAAEGLRQATVEDAAASRMPAAICAASSLKP